MNYLRIHVNLPGGTHHIDVEIWQIVTAPALFPEDLRQRELAWPVGKR